MSEAFVRSRAAQKGQAAPMKTTRSQLLATLLLMAGALVVGMILAGGGKLTPAGFSATGPQRLQSSKALAASLPSFADLADTVIPAVVTVRSVTIGNQPTRANPFEFFFGPRDQPGAPGNPREFRGEGAGRLRTRQPPKLPDGLDPFDAAPVPDTLHLRR